MLESHLQTALLYNSGTLATLLRAVAKKNSVLFGLVNIHNRP
jgi:hypothetical protein